MTDPAYRLRKARESAGFASAAEAAQRFHWNYATYAGHENGHRGLGRAAQTYARAFRVNLSWLLTGDDSPKLALDQVAQPGFGESDVEPMRQPDKRRSDLIDDLAKKSTPGSRHQVFLRCKRDMLSIGLRRDDILIIGTPNGEPTTGLVVVNLADTALDHTITVLRQEKKGILFAPIGLEVPDEDHLDAVIMGHVMAVIRAPQLVY